MSQAGRLVEEGETVTYDGVGLTVESTENNRILEVRVELSDAKPRDTNSPDEE